MNKCNRNNREANQMKKQYILFAARTRYISRASQHWQAMDIPQQSRSIQSATLHQKWFWNIIVVLMEIRKNAFNV